MTVAQSRAKLSSLEFPLLVGVAPVAGLLQLADWGITQWALTASPRFIESNPINAYLFEANPLAALMPKIFFIVMLSLVTWIARGSQLRYLAWGVIGGALAAGILTMTHNIDIVLRALS